MTESQTTSNVLMVRPVAFSGNEQTAPSNRFQVLEAQDNQRLQFQAADEFDSLVKVLRGAGINVFVFDDTPHPLKPDALFPNNWVSFHADGSAVLYPMLAANRRLERRTDLLDKLCTQHGFNIARLIDLTAHENSGRFLEGTGSLVLDRQNRIAYANLSARTDPLVMREYSQRLDYELVTFAATDRNDVPIYHTNVLMSIGTNFTMICTKVISDLDRKRVLERLRAHGREIIDIAPEQMQQFAGNILELKTNTGESILAMSTRAEKSLTPKQRTQLENIAGRIVASSIPTIETIGGGSVRCMLAEIHLPRMQP